MKKEISLNIGYDAKRAVCNMTGLGNYSRYVIDVMSRCYPVNRYFLYSPKNKKNPRLKPLLERSSISLTTPNGIWKYCGAIWRSLEMTRKLLEDDINIFHGLSNELPMNISRADIPSVVTIHDLIWRKVPKDYASIDRKLYDFKYKESAKAATRVIAISECTKCDLVVDFGIEPQKIDVIYQGCGPIFRENLNLEKKKEIKAKYNLPERYIACVGTVQSRKNQLLPILGMRGLPKDIKLIVAGKRDKDYAKILDNAVSKNHLEDRIIWLESIDYNDLPYIYGMAQFSAYTSRYEGFGIPIIESLTVGTPVIAATGSCLEEAGGRGAIYVGPDDVDNYIAEASRLIDNYYYRNKLSQLGLSHVKKFNDENFARQTMACYNKAILDFVN